MSSSDLQALFSNLKPRSDQGRNSASPAPTSVQQSSSIFPQTRTPATPPPPTPPFATSTERPTSALPVHGSAGNTRTASHPSAQNLLNVLNFGGSQTSSRSKNSAATANAASREQSTNRASLSASDLVARILSPSNVEAQTPGTTKPVPRSGGDQLIDLLNRQPVGTRDVASPDITSTSVNLLAGDAPELSDISREFTNGNAGPGSASRSTEENPQPSSPAAKPIFTYTNPFEALNASRVYTPQTTTAAPPSASSFKFENSQQEAYSSPASISARKKLTPRLRSQRSGLSPQAEAYPYDDPATDQYAQSPIASTELTSTIEMPNLPLRQEQVRSIPRSANDVPEVEMGNVEGQDGSGEWEDADELSDKDHSSRVVPVYNFPIKAFVSITLQLPSRSDVGIREGSVMEISRLKKDFDQLDRSLAAATNKYITYAFTKHGGMRIIRQDDGVDRHVFKHSHDRVFNVALCTSATLGPSSSVQGVLGTGVSGTVYYATIYKEGNDLFEKDQLESESLVFPPWPPADENTAGGILKTRAKRSSRHPEFFAIGRGKSIHIIWPSTASSEKYLGTRTARTVDIEKYYQDRPLHIQTGKAGKDFTFSEDDSVIVSLDKTGRLRFWDIRALVDPQNAAIETRASAIVDTPMLSLSTASPAEKSWPTSVLFVDKARPYNKGGALRYILVGLRQNHVLQLWDIALGKAVQELNFSHENETDGICSVNYHPASGIIVVGHPTRNSIFFIHLSAPRYNLSSQLTQAAYVSRVASKDNDLPKPDSTACMSGIREISFAEKGELRSVELLPIQKGTDSTKTADGATASDPNASLFELYIAHSKGVTCLAINKQDLGWNADGKVVHGIDAQVQGLVALKDLKLGSVIEEPTRTKSPVRDPQLSSKPSKKKSKKAPQATEEFTLVAEGNYQVTDEVSTTTELPAPAFLDVKPREVLAPKESKKSKKKAAASTLSSESPSKQDTRSPSPTKALPSSTENKLSEKHIKDTTSGRENGDVISALPTTNAWVGEIRKIEEAVSTEFRKEFAALQQNISTDRAALDQSSLSRQEAIIRLVSNDLSTNVEKSLSRIVVQQIQTDVLPNLRQIASENIEKALNQQLRQVLAKEVASHLPGSISTALESTFAKNSASEKIVQKLSAQLEKQISESVTRVMTPLCKSIAETAATSVSNGLRNEFKQQVQQLRDERAADQIQLEKFSNAVSGLAKTLQAMSDSQVAFQDQILRDRHQLVATGGVAKAENSHQTSTARDSDSPSIIANPTPIKPRSAAEIELDEISDLMSHGQYEAGTIKWLQSTQPVQLFDDVFVRFTPEYLGSEVSPLVAFSVAVTVANALNTHIDRRLEWISTAFDAVDPTDPELLDLTNHAPALISAIIQKLESLYMTLAERQHNDPVLKSIPTLVKKAREMRDQFLTKGWSAQT